MRHRVQSCTARLQGCLVRNAVLQPTLYFVRIHSVKPSVTSLQWLNSCPLLRATSSPRAAVRVTAARTRLQRAGGPSGAVGVTDRPAPRLVPLTTDTKISTTSSDQLPAATSQKINETGVEWQPGQSGHRYHSLGSMRPPAVRAAASSCRLYSRRTVELTTTISADDI